MVSDKLLNQIRSQRKDLRAKESRRLTRSFTLHTHTIATETIPTERIIQSRETVISKKRKSRNRPLIAERFHHHRRHMKEVTHPENEEDERTRWQPQLHLSVGLGKLKDTLIRKPKLLFYICKPGGPVWAKMCGLRPDLVLIN